MPSCPSTGLLPRLRRMRLFFLIAGIAILAAGIVSGQKTQKIGVHPTEPKQQREDKSKLTDEVSAKLPAAPKLPVKRENLIDDYIFGAMERDHIPHAPLASDEVFFR